MPAIQSCHGAYIHETKGLRTAPGVFFFVSVAIFYDFYFCAYVFE